MRTSRLSSLAALRGAPLRPSLLALGVAASLALPAWVQAADIDVFGRGGKGGPPNLMFYLDNTSNWSANNQAWDASSSWTDCVTKAKAMEKAEADVYLANCKRIVNEIYYKGSTSGLRPWDGSFNGKKDNVSLVQGQVELRAIRLVLNDLVCKSDSPLSLAVGLSMFPRSTHAASVRSNSDTVLYIRRHVQTLTTSYCTTLIKELDTIDGEVNDPSSKTSSSVGYAAGFYELFKYFGGFTNPDLAAAGTAGSPVGAQGYGPVRFSKNASATPEDPAAFVDVARTTYKSPITSLKACGSNYIMLIGNGYPPKTSDRNVGGPVAFSGLNYTPPKLTNSTADADLYADEWAYFLANTDHRTGTSLTGIQAVKTLAVNVYRKSPDAGQTNLLKSIAHNGGLGVDSGYIEVGGDIVELVEGIKNATQNIAADNSVFSAVTLPVSTTTQGTYLNQVFVGMFRPDGDSDPRWLGNLKQYELGYVNGAISMLDAKGKPAVSGKFFSTAATSFWSADSVFFQLGQSGDPKSASDAPDGQIVEKGGVAFKLRSNHELGTRGQDSSRGKVRKVYTLPASPGSGVSLSATPFASSNSVVTAKFSTDEINWIRGENNVSGEGAEDFNGSYRNASNVITELGTTGARHSIHGDVVHSRPVALNYGSSSGEAEVVVFYGANDGHFRAVDGRKKASTGGDEIWSFIAPEHYDYFERQRKLEPNIVLPEINEFGNVVKADNVPKSYTMDGPVGVYARYSGDKVVEAIVYPSMRKGGNSVYALDVSKRDDPKFLWKVTGGSGDYAKLGQTWSLPRAVVFSDKSEKPPVVLVMGGGYDMAEEQNTDNSTPLDASKRIGNAVFIIEARTGKLLKQIDTDYAVPSDVTVLDVNGDGEPDRAYVGDVRGNLYRIDFPGTGSMIDASTWADVKAVKIASLDSKIFYPPDVVVTKGFVAVLVGTGDREKPLWRSSKDHFYLIKDNVGTPRATTLQRSDLTRVARITSGGSVTDTVTTAVEDAEGCYLEMGKGEKIVNGAFTISGVTYFGTTSPSTTDFEETCTDNVASNYEFPLFCGVPDAPTRIANGGLLPSPVGGIVDINGVKVPVIIGTKDSPFKAAEPKPKIKPVRNRLNWRVSNSNR